MPRRHRSRRIRRRRRGCSLRGRERRRGVHIQREQGRRFAEVQSEAGRLAVLADLEGLRYLHLGTPGREPRQSSRHRRGRLSVRRGGPAEIRAGRRGERDLDVPAKDQIAEEHHVLQDRRLDVLRRHIRTRLSA